jgi:predicted pyridoxine 5'-phosphate oxidase superfamily flavin-nucleotide-binding protein
MFFLATVDADGSPQCSYKGGEPGFVRVLDEQTIAFPSFDGNGMYLSLGNIAETSRVGLLFIDFEGQKRLRLNGVASIDPDDPLLGEYPRAQAVVRVRATEVFPNCPRYVHKLQLVERSRFTPRADWPEAQFVMRVRATEVFPNCPRYIHEYRLVKRSRFVPKTDCDTPVPAWKRSEWAHDALAENDPANDPSREVIPR